MRARSLISAVILAAIFVMTAGSYALAERATVIPARITGTTRLAGELVLEGIVVVEKTAVLIIAAGSEIAVRPSGAMTVIGKFEVAGSSSAPVSIAPSEGEKWGGITFTAGASGTFSNARISGADSALLLVASEVLITDSFFNNNKKGLFLSRESSTKVVNSRFESNEVGIAAEMRSRSQISMCYFKENKIGIGVSSGALPKITGNRFENNQAAIKIHQRYKETVTGNIFVKNGVGVSLYQNGPDTVLEKNLFIDSVKSAVVAEFFSSPQIVNNRITGGRFGIYASQFSSPAVVSNSITGSKGALHLNKKSMAVIKRNVIAGSEVGVFCDFSSYPMLRNNYFDNNKLHLKLGRFQSSHWEKEAGSGKLTLANASRMNSRNPRLAGDTVIIPDAVDAAWNWWDNRTGSEMDEAGADENISSLFDGYDLPEVTYEGFGGTSYRLDKITYLPRLTEAPDKVGIRGWNGNEDELEVP